MAVNKILQQYFRLAAGRKREMQRVTYIVTAYLMHQLSKLLLGAERVCFATGIVPHSNLIVMTEPVLADFDASAVHVRPDPARTSSTKSLRPRSAA